MGALKLIVATKRCYQTELTLAVLQIAKSAPRCWQIYGLVFFTYTLTRMHVRTQLQALPPLSAGLTRQAVTVICTVRLWLGSRKSWAEICALVCVCVK